MLYSSRGIKSWLTSLSQMNLSFDLLHKGHDNMEKNTYPFRLKTSVDVQTERATGSEQGQMVAR